MTMVQARAGPLQVVGADLGPVPEPPRLADRLDGHLLAAGAARQDRQEGEDGRPDDSGPSGRDGHDPIVVTLVANSSRPSETGVFSRQDALSCPDSGLSAADGNSPP